MATLSRPSTWRLFLTALLGIVFSSPVTAGWEQQWIDRFDGSGVDWNNWTAQTEANYNAEAQCYTADDSSMDKNYDVSSGTLTIIARRQMINCPGLPEIRDWSSGRLNSKDKREFQYGRVEARIRVLDTKGGSWPAFWMLENRIAEQPIANDNDFVTWPNPGAGEIDVWEWFSNDGGRYITNFFNNSAGCFSGNDVRYSYPNGVVDVQNWHDYAVEWDANEARFYIDDTLVRTQNLLTCGQYEEPMFILLNVAIGGTLGGAVDPTMTQTRMEVDYVAHCTPTNSNSAARCNESTPGITSNLIIFEITERSDWAAWDSAGGTNPGVVTDSDMVYAEVMEFNVIGNTVTGFTARAPFATGGVPFDASGIVTTGTVEFDLKMTALPAAGASDWKLKLESTAAATAVEVSLTTSNEGHAAPVLNQWQHYSFNLSDLVALGLDPSAIDLVLVFPEFGTGNGAAFRIDNVEILSNVAQSPPPPAPGNSGRSSGGGGSSFGTWLVLLLTGLTLYRRLGGK